MRKLTCLTIGLFFFRQLSSAMKVASGSGTGIGIPILVVENGNGLQFSIHDGFHEIVNNDNYLNYNL